jgi:hypothetical protein
MLPSSISFGLTQNIQAFKGFHILPGIRLQLILLDEGLHGFFTPLNNSLASSRDHWLQAAYYSGIFLNEHNSKIVKKSISFSLPLDTLTLTSASILEQITYTTLIRSTSIWHRTRSETVFQENAFRKSVAEYSPSYNQAFGCPALTMEESVHPKNCPAQHHCPTIFLYINIQRARTSGMDIVNKD